MGYITGKKDLIIDFLCDNHDKSFTLEEICDHILPDGKGRRTVYRIVSELVEKKCVRRISDGRTRHCTYQYIGGERCHRHLHLKCRDCGKLIHLDEKVSHDFEKKVMVAGFAIEEGTLLFGTCKDCTGVKA